MKLYRNESQYEEGLKEAEEGLKEAEEGLKEAEGYAYEIDEDIKIREEEKKEI